jgi:hypothetical protein
MDLVKANAYGAVPWTFSGARGAGSFRSPVSVLPVVVPTKQKLDKLKTHIRTALPKFKSQHAWSQVIGRFADMVVSGNTGDKIQVLYLLDELKRIGKTNDATDTLETYLVNALPPFELDFNDFMDLSESHTLRKIDGKIYLSNRDGNTVSTFDGKPVQAVFYSDNKIAFKAIDDDRKYLNKEYKFDNIPTKFTLRPENSQLVPQNKAQIQLDNKLLPELSKALQQQSLVKAKKQTQREKTWNEARKQAFEQVKKQVDKSGLSIESDYGKQALKEMKAQYIKIVDDILDDEKFIDSITDESMLQAGPHNALVQRIKGELKKYYGQSKAGSTPTLYQTNISKLAEIILAALTAKIFPWIRGRGGTRGAGRAGGAGRPGRAGGAGRAGRAGGGADGAGGSGKNQQGWSAPCTWKEYMEQYYPAIQA